jgi:hypothetical protein
MFKWACRYCKHCVYEENDGKIEGYCVCPIPPCFLSYDADGKPTTNLRPKVDMLRTMPGCQCFEEKS